MLSGVEMRDWSVVGGGFGFAAYRSRRFGREVYWVIVLNPFTKRSKTITLTS